MPSPLSGPGIVDGKVPPGDYVMSATYLRLKPGEDINARFFELVGPVFKALGESDGLIGYSVGQSAECATARTLSVWRDEQAMYEFVTGPAHAAAMAAIGEVSRGGSVAMHWLGSADAANWEAGAAQVSAHTGREY